MNLWSYLITAVWFFLPAGAANAVPVLASKLPLLKHWRTPLDGGKSYRGHRVFGDNKTVRGVVVGTITAGIVAALQYAIGHGPHLPARSLSSTIAIGLLMGLGALLGDAIESFFKRQHGVRPGNGWFPFDQTDYIIGGLLVSYPLAHPSWQLIVATLATWFGVHLLSVYIGYLLGIRDKPI